MNNDRINHGLDVRYTATSPIYHVTDAATAAVAVKAAPRHTGSWKATLFEYGRIQVKYRYLPEKGDKRPTLNLVYNIPGCGKPLGVLLGYVGADGFQIHSKFRIKHVRDAWKLYHAPGEGYLKILWNYARGFFMLLEIVYELRTYQTDK